ncbi:MAG: hypothetical protein HN350_18660 [Phycisphaerales bacterium]|jgi:hypothetical protein|nr:hypothetical protein [Phycisphaerales bacterium]
MQSVEEMEKFMEWYARCNEQDSLEHIGAYARRVLTDAAGRSKKYRCGVGTVLLGPGGLAFLRKGKPIPLWGKLTAFVGFVAIVVLGSMIGMQTGTPPMLFIIISMIVLSIAMGCWARQPVDLNNPAKLQKTARDPLSVYIPLSQIADHRVLAPLGLGESECLGIFYHDQQDLTHELVLGDKTSSRISFNAEEMDHLLAIALGETE